MLTTKWLRAAAIRALKTAAQTAVATIGSEQIGVLQADWRAVFSIAAMAAILSLLNSLAGLPEAK